jgi:hypothetical protein
MNKALSIPFGAFKATIAKYFVPAAPVMIAGGAAEKGF